MSADVWVSLLLLVNSVIYIWVGRNLVSREAYDLPRIFWNPTSRLIAAYLPFLGFIAVILAAFATTSHGWWYLAATAAVFFLFAVRPRYFGQ